GSTSVDMLGAFDGALALAGWEKSVVAAEAISATGSETVAIEGGKPLWTTADGIPVLARTQYGSGTVSAYFRATAVQRESMAGVSDSVLTSDPQMESYRLLGTLIHATGLPVSLNEPKSLPELPGVEAAALDNSGEPATNEPRRLIDRAIESRKEWTGTYDA